MRDPNAPDRHLEIRRRLVGLTKQSAHQHIDVLAKKHLNLNVYARHNDSDVHLIYRIAPERFTQMG